MSTTTTVAGTLVREPEIRYTREGQAVTQLGVEANDLDDADDVFEVICWRDLAENVALSLTKGMRVIVTGELSRRTWETEEGDTHHLVEIVATEVGPSLLTATADVQRVERRSTSSDDKSNT